MRNRPSHSSPVRRAGVVAFAALAAALGLAAADVRGADPPKGGSGAFVIHLRNGGFAHGEPADSDRPGVLRWRPAAFAGPLEFGTNIVTSVHRLGAAALSKPEGAYGFWLAGGDVVFGDLVEMGEVEAVLAVPRLGRLHVERRVIHRMERLGGGAELVYVGPNGLAGWRDASRVGGAWSEESGQISTKQEGASIHGDLGLPASAIVELELSWKVKPDFVLALGVDGTEPSRQRAFRFEVWDGQIVVHRETERDADVLPVVKAAAGPGRVHLFAYLDQKGERIVVVSPQGKRLADMTVVGQKPQVLPGIHLTNVRGDVRLERLRIGRWGGELTRAVGDGPRVQLSDGSVVGGQVTRFDPGPKEYVVAAESGEKRVAEAQVANVFLSTPADDPAPRAVLVSDSDGARLSGELLRIEKGDLCLAIPGIKESPRIPVSALRSLLVLRHEGAQPLDDRSTRLLELEGVRLFGRLVDAQERPGSSCLAWQPLGSGLGSPLRPGVSGQIISNWWEPEKPAPARAARQQQQKMGAFQIQMLVQVQVQEQVAISGGRAVPAPRGEVQHARALHLRTGDLIPAEVTRIDEKGVWFRSSLSDNQFVAHEKVQAVELDEELRPAARLTDAKRERLLTLPRMQKDSPPTHLIRSHNGDYLRGRLLAMDDQKLKVEVRLETKEVARDRVSKIIWLHSEKSETPAAPDAPKAKPEAATRVQAILKDGIRLTYSPDRLAGTVLSGTSEVIGACRVRLEDVERLLIGDAIEREAARLTYQQWALRDAPEPKAATAGEDGAPGGRMSGIDSALVGKPAPDFELELLGGKKFRLSEAKGKIVVLDFWATWCGPCLRAMPQVEGVAREFRDKDVQLVAVNLQETEKQVSAMLERHKLDVTVALDRDGLVAAKYAANAIPQTVVIDRNGSITRLFVGGGPQLGDQLREAIEALMTKPDAAEIRK